MMKTKITLHINEDGYDISGVKSERVWAEKIGDKVYKIINIPFYAFGFCFGDEIYVRDVEAPSDESDIIEYSDNSTILLLVMDPLRKDFYINLAESWKCQYESAVDRKSFVISVSVDISLKKVISDLERITAENDDGFVISAQRHYPNNDIFHQQ